MEEKVENPTNVSENEKKDIKKISKRQKSEQKKRIFTILQNELNPEIFEEWMNTVAPGLNMLSPKEAIANGEGEKVIKILERVLSVSTKK